MLVRNRPLPSSSASPYLNSSPFSTNQPVRTTFLGQSVNELTTAPIRVVSRPQQSNNNNLPPPLEPRKPNRSRDFYGCLSNCLTLSHYNPVCGTDHTTYHNVYKLDCANRCGARPRKFFFFGQSFIMCTKSSFLLSFHLFAQECKFGGPESAENGSKFYEWMRKLNV